MQRSRWLTVTIAAIALPYVVSAEPSIVKQPPEGAFKMREALRGKHPRLYFTREDIPRLRRLAKGPRKWFLDRAKKSFGGYAGKQVQKNAKPWKDYLYGFWGQFTMDMVYVVEGNAKYADTAKSWALHYANRTDWLKDDLIPMEIVSGMALTYDILYDRLTDAERRTIRRSLLRAMQFMHKKFFIGKYWTNDFQNNHMHNRIHGLAHAAFAVYGDDPDLDAQKYADLAYGCWLEMLKWLPEDGSNHEGPGYWNYGHHWAARVGHLMEHVTGEKFAKKNPHLLRSHYFRIYMSTPGWKSIMNIGDGGGGHGDSLTTLARSIGEAKDPYGRSVLDRLMQTAPDGFYRYPAWGLLWYDHETKAKPYRELPLWRFWPDLEMFSIRSSWDDDATCLVFKCGPPGGHRLQRLRGSRWANVAHDHPDQNHFLLFAHGKMLAEDDGYPKQKKLTSSHNTVTVDGKGQPREGTGWQQPFDYKKTGFLDDVFLSRNCAYAAGNGSRLYDGADRFVRHIAFLEGQYLIVLDDLVGAGGREHDFEWRLHKDGQWSEAGPGDFRVTDGDVSLRIEFLDDAREPLAGRFLPKDLTASPCLAVSRRASKTQFLAVIVPQKGGRPRIEATRLKATGCAAVRGVQGKIEDLFAVSSGNGRMKFADVAAKGASVLLRREKGALRWLLLTRGTSAEVDKTLIVRATKPANIAWHREKKAFRIEIEAPYKGKGAKTSLEVGGLRARAMVRVSVDGEKPRRMKAGPRGTVKLAVDLSERRTIVLRQ